MEERWRMTEDVEESFTLSISGEELRKQKHCNSRKLASTLPSAFASGPRGNKLGKVSLGRSDRQARKHLLHMQLGSTSCQVPGGLDHLSARATQQSDAVGCGNLALPQLEIR